MPFPPFAVTVDLVALTVRDGALHALLVTRGEEPFLGRLRAARRLRPPRRGPRRPPPTRELAEETGLSAVAPPGAARHVRRPAPRPAPARGRPSPTWRWPPICLTPVPGGDAARPAGSPVADALEPDLAFDHARDPRRRGRARPRPSSSTHRWPPRSARPEFTVSELRHVYEAVWGVALDPRNFHRKVTSTAGFLTRRDAPSSTAPAAPPPSTAAARPPRCTRRSSGRHRALSTVMYARFSRGRPGREGQHQPAGPRDGARRPLPASAGPASVRPGPVRSAPLGDRQAAAPEPRAVTVLGISRHPQASAWATCHSTRRSRLAPVPSTCAACHSSFTDRSRRRTTVVAHTVGACPVAGSMLARWR